MQNEYDFKEEEGYYNHIFIHHHHHFIYLLHGTWDSSQVRTEDDCIALHFPIFSHDFKELTAGKL